MGISLFEGLVLGVVIFVSMVIVSAYISYPKG